MTRPRPGRLGRVVGGEREVAPAAAHRRRGRETLVEDDPVGIVDRVVDRTLEHVGDPGDLQRRRYGLSGNGGLDENPPRDVIEAGAGQILRQDALTADRFDGLPVECDRHPFDVAELRKGENDLGHAHRGAPAGPFVVVSLADVVVTGEVSYRPHALPTSNTPSTESTQIVRFIRSACQPACAMQRGERPYSYVTAAAILDTRNRREGWEHR